MPTPFGLVRGGVAPDHPKIKSLAAVFDKIARDQRVRYYGNVEVGSRLGMSMLQRNYDAVVIATGAGRSTRLPIPGANLCGAYGATEFVSLYNGVPDCSDRIFDFSAEEAAVVGHGNVAADTCRILLTPVDILAKTDIACHALEQLAESRVRHVHLIGRRGPVQAKFFSSELRERGAIPNCTIDVSPDDLVLNKSSEVELSALATSTERKDLELLREFAARSEPQRVRRLSLHLSLSPI